MLKNSIIWNEYTWYVYDVFTSFVILIIFSINLSNHSHNFMPQSSSHVAISDLLGGHLEKDTKISLGLLSLELLNGYLSMIDSEEIDKLLVLFNILD
jgi:hypothetical protein